MFQLKDIKEAQSKVKSVPDFPAYIQELIKLSVTKYYTFVYDDLAVFFGDNDYQIQSESKYSALTVVMDNFKPLAA